MRMHVYRWMIPAVFALLAACGGYTTPPPAPDAAWALYGGDAGVA